MKLLILIIDTVRPLCFKYSCKGCTDKVCCTMCDIAENMIREGCYFG